MPPSCTLAELEQWSSTGDLAETIGTAVGVPLVLVTGGPHEQPSPSPGLRADLRSLMCVLVDEPGRHAPSGIADVAPAGVRHADVLETVRRHPVAATALIALLRSERERTVDAGLVAESSTYSMLQSGAEFAEWNAARAAPSALRLAGRPIELTRHDDVLTITLDRPEVHNAYDTAMRDALVEALRLAMTDSDLQVVLRGRGRSFCSGGDLAEFGSRADPASAHAVRLTRSAARLLARLRDRTVVHVHGACIGSGIELAAFARRIVAHPDTSFALPEVGFGLIPGAGGTVSLPARIGRQRTALLALCGGPIDAATALEWGLVDELDAGVAPG